MFLLEEAFFIGRSGDGFFGRIGLGIGGMGAWS